MHDAQTRVLAVEDSNAQAELLQSFLQDERLAAEAGGSFVVTRVADLAGALAQLSRDERFDVVLLDLTLPDSDGIATLDAVRAATELPVVVLSASEPEAGYEAVEHGAQDFVVKDARSLAALPRVLRFAVRRAALHRELADAVAASEEAHARLQTFISMASHELRSPLATIQGLSTVLVSRWDQLEEEQRRDFAARMDRRLGQMTAVATLYLNAADGDDIHAVPVELDLVAAVDEVVAAVPVPPDVVAVVPGRTVFDPSHLAAILVNLLTNAVKYGAAPIHLEGDADRVVVSDAGPGVREADVPHLFDPWHRRAREGADSTGLGLALAAELARANGAKLDHERVEGRTRFVLQLPAVAGPPRP